MNNNKKLCENKKWELVNFCEFDKYAEKSYCAIHNVDPSRNLGDITKVDENNLSPFNMICGGSPCFVAGTKVFTKNGYKNIEDIKVGDMVLTHRNRFMPVLRNGGEVDKEIYKLKVTNKSKYTILLDDRKDVDAMYIKDQNDVEYHAYTHEITDSELTLDPRQTKEIEIKYYNKYGSDKEIEEMVFSRMILDNDAYQIYDDKTQYKYYSEFHIEIK